MELILNLGEALYTKMFITVISIIAQPKYPTMKIFSDPV